MRNTSIKYKAWIYLLPNDWKVIVGKTDQDNDIISTQVIDPEEWWFHVANLPGSHVVLTHEENLEPDRDILKKVATIAAWHSKARNAKKTTVHACKGKYVSKPRGTKPGLVTISHITELSVYLQDPVNFTTKE